MKEIEVKVLNISIPEITKKLLALGATHVGRVLIIEKNFDFKNKNISRRKHSLRLRKRGERTELTYKTKSSDEHEFKILEETEINVNDFKITEKILRAIGLTCIKHREKYRTSFVLDSTNIEIDEYPIIPPYLEIEGAPEKIKKCLASLGYNIKDTSNLSSTRVLKKYKVRHDFLTFKTSPVK